MHRTLDGATNRNPVSTTHDVAKYHESAGARNKETEPPHQFSYHCNDVMVRAPTRLPNEFRHRLSGQRESIGEAPQQKVNRITGNSLCYAPAC